MNSVNKQLLRAHAAPDGTITVATISDVLGLHYEQANARAGTWAARGHLVYTGRRATYGIPGIAQPRPTRRWRWNDVLELLAIQPDVSAGELAAKADCNWRAASSLLRRYASSGDLVRVADGRYALASHAQGRRIAGPSKHVRRPLVGLAKTRRGS